jgi:heptosyltransferase III
MPTLLYHTGALGDFITIIPALRFWKNRNPGDRVILLGKPAIGEFSKEIGLIDDWLDADSSRLRPLFCEECSSATADFPASFTSAIIFSHPDSLLLRHCRERSEMTVRWQPPFPSSRIPIVDYHLALFADPATVPARDKLPSILPPARALADAQTIIAADQKPVALHPGSGSRRKNWPFERYLSVAKILQAKGIPVMWVRGPADDAYDAPRGDLAVSMAPLPLCAALLSRCRGFIGNDSGLAHLAAAVGCPTVAIFGPSDPLVWAPRGEHVRIVVGKRPHCSPCHPTSAGEPMCDHACLDSITAEEVAAAYECVSGLQRTASP